MSDQIQGMIRDSDVKFQCRLLLAMLQSSDLPEVLIAMFLEPIHEIVRLENQRLDAAKKAATRIQG